MLECPAGVTEQLSSSVSSSVVEWTVKFSGADTIETNYESGERNIQYMYPQALHTYLKNFYLCSFIIFKGLNRLEEDTTI